MVNKRNESQVPAGSRKTEKANGKEGSPANKTPSANSTGKPVSSSKETGSRPRSESKPRPAAGKAPQTAAQNAHKPRPATGKPKPAGSAPRNGAGKKDADAPRGQSAPEKRPPEKPKAKPAPANQEPVRIALPALLTVRDLADVLDVSPIDIIKELMANGIIANINQQLDYDTAAIVAEELGFETYEEQRIVQEETSESGPVTIWQRICETERPEDLHTRPPVVTVMGHVDHGKTSLLDVIRHTDVAADEAGGITQRIGAYQVEVDGKKITFLDTPGHEAFTAMRARGALATDLAILVVAADDGVMPQTKEAIDHARAAHVPIVVALNKVDKANANPDLVKQQLADQGLMCEEWGGDVICVPISAKKNTGIEELLENILLVAEVNNLRANPNCPAIGTVIEGQLDRGRGALATVLIQNGTLRVGDIVTVGRMFGRIRAMLNDKGKRVKEATPSTPVKILGLPEVPAAGEVLEVVENEHLARQIVARRRDAQRVTTVTEMHRPVSLEEVFAQIQAGKVKELNLILKADVQGTLEPIQNSLEKIEYENLKVRFIHVGTGNVSESDISLAVASGAIVIAFAVEVDAAARRMADSEGVDIRFYDVIYKLIEDVDKALRGMLEPKYENVLIGKAQVRALFRIPRKGTIAGTQVTEGVALRNAIVRVVRGQEVLYEGKLSSLKRFTEDVQEVKTGFECGIGIDGFDNLAEDDVFEFYKKERVS